MALISRLTNLVGRMIGTSDVDDAWEREAAEGFLMSTAAEPAAAFPQMPASEPPAEGPFAQPIAGAQAEDGEAALGDEAALELEALEQVADTPAKVASSAASLAEPTELAEEAPPAPPLAQPVAQVAAAAPVAPHVVAVQGDSTDDMMAMFRNTSGDTESHGLTKDLEDVTAAELLEEARALRDLFGCAGQGEETDAA